MPSFLLRRQDFFFLSFLFFSFEQCTSTKILLRVAIFFFFNLGWLWVSQFILIFCVYPSVLSRLTASHKAPCWQRQAVSHKVHSHCHMPELPDDEESSELLRNKALMRPQRSRGGQCFPFAVEESSTSQGSLITKNPLMQIIWFPASKESQVFFPVERQLSNFHFSCFILLLRNLSASVD